MDTITGYQFYGYHKNMIVVHMGCLRIFIIITLVSIFLSEQSGNWILLSSYIFGLPVDTKSARVINNKSMVDCFKNKTSAPPL